MMPIEHGIGNELLVVLAVGTMVIVATAALAGRFIHSAVWQRTLWQVTVLGLLALTVAELTGAADLTVRLLVPRRAVSQVSEATSIPERSAGAAASLARATRADRLPMFSGVSDLVRLGHDERSASSPDADVDADSALSPIAPMDSLKAEHGRYEAKPLLDSLNSREFSYGVGVTTELAPTNPPGVWWPGVTWGIGAVLLAVRLLWGRAVLFVFRHRRTSAADGVACRRVGRLAERLGFRRRVVVLKSSKLATPVAFGWLRPVIVLPSGFTESFDTAEQEAMLTHELAHLAAGDPAWRLLADVLTTALWWHPAAWWSRRCLLTAGEVAADEASLLVPGGPDVLAGCLVSLGRKLTHTGRLGWLAVEGEGFKSSLGRRVQRLLSLSTRPHRVPGRRTLAVAKTVLPVTFVVTAICCTAWARPRAETLEGGTTMNVLKSSWGRSLAAVALTALWAPTAGDVAAEDSSPKESAFAAANDGQPPNSSFLAQRDERRDREIDAQRQREMAEHARATAEERRELEERARDIRRELEKPVERSREEGLKLRRALEEIEERLGDLPRDRDRPRQDPEQMERRLEEVMHAMRRAMEEGRRDEAQRLEREAVAIRSVLDSPQPRSPLEVPRPEKGEDLERRLRHLRAAIDNLHEADMHEPAERLEAEFNRLRLEAGERAGRDLDLPGPPRDRREQPPHGESLGGAVEQLRGEVERLHREMDEMRRNMERMHDFLERRMDGEDRQQAGGDRHEHEHDENGGH